MENQHTKETTMHANKKHKHKRVSQFAEAPLVALDLAELFAKPARVRLVLELVQAPVLARHEDAASRGAHDFGDEDVVVGHGELGWRGEGKESKEDKHEGTEDTTTGSGSLFAEGGGGEEQKTKRLGSKRISDTAEDWSVQRTATRVTSEAVARTSHRGI